MQLNILKLKKLIEIYLNTLVQVYKNKILQKTVYD